MLASRVTGVIGEYYNRTALNVFNGAGNERMAVYAESAGSPNGILAEGSSKSAVTGFANYHNLGDFALTTLNAWIAFQVSGSDDLYYSTTGLPVNEKYVSQAYGAFPSSITASTDNNNINMKMNSI